jgi:hypothetical protein
MARQGASLVFSKNYDEIKGLLVARRSGLVWLAETSHSAKTLRANLFP